MLLDNLKLPTRPILMLVGVLASILSACGPSEPGLEIERYRLKIIVMDKLGAESDRLPEEIQGLAHAIEPACKDLKVYLPGRESRITGLGWHSLPEIPYYVDRACTPTQISSGNCTLAQIDQKVEQWCIGNVIEGDFSEPSDYSKAGKDSMLLDYLAGLEESNSAIFALTTQAEDGLYNLGERAFEAFPTADSLRERIEREICNLNRSIIILYHPPGKKKTFVAPKPPIKPKPEEEREEVDKPELEEEDSAKSEVPPPLDEEFEITFRSRSIEWPHRMEGDEYAVRIEKKDGGQKVFNKKVKKPSMSLPMGKLVDQIVYRVIVKSKTGEVAEDEFFIELGEVAPQCKL